MLIFFLVLKLFIFGLVKRLLGLVKLFGLVDLDKFKNNYMYKINFKYCNVCCEN